MIAVIGGVVSARPGIEKRRNFNIGCRSCVRSGSFANARSDRAIAGGDYPIALGASYRCSASKSRTVIDRTVRQTSGSPRGLLGLDADQCTAFSADVCFRANGFDD